MSKPVFKRPLEPISSQEGPSKKLREYEDINQKVTRALEKMTCDFKFSKDKPVNDRFLDEHASRVTEITLNSPQVYPVEWIQNNIDYLSSLKILKLKGILLHHGFLTRIQTNKSIEKLKLSISCCFNCDARQRELRRMLKSDFPLKALSVTEDGCAPDTARSLFRNLQENDSLKSLSLKIKDIEKFNEEEEPFFDDLGESLAEMIAANQGLEKLKITHVNISDDEANMIAEALKKNTTLKHLDLWGCNMSSEAVKVILNAMKENELGIFVD